MSEDGGEGEASRKLIADRIRERMHAVGLNQTELRKRVGASSATVSRWLNAKDTPKGVWIGKLAGALQTSADYLTGREEAVRMQDTDMVDVFVRVLGEMANGRPLDRGQCGLPLELLTRIEDAAPRIVAALDQISGGSFASLSPERQEAVLQEVGNRVLAHIRRPR